MAHHAGSNENFGAVRPLKSLHDKVDKHLRVIEPVVVLIGGEEDFWSRKRRTTYMQVLWARPLPPPAKEPVPPASTGSRGSTPFGGASLNHQLAVATPLALWPAGASPAIQ